MCFKRLDLFNHVLNETGSPVSTIDNTRNFHAPLEVKPFDLGQNGCHRYSCSAHPVVPKALHRR